MGRAPRQAQVPIGVREPVDDARWGQTAASFGIDNMTSAVRYFEPPRQGLSQIVVQGNPPSAAHFCRDIVQFDICCDAAARIEDHRPGQFSDFASPQARFD
jgi:hypothetical protein